MSDRKIGGLKKGGAIIIDKLLSFAFFKLSLIKRQFEVSKNQECEQFTLTTTN